MSRSRKPIARLGSIGASKAEKEALRALRERFIGDPLNTDLSGLRPVIARSWQRSALCSVSPEKKILETMAEPRLDEQFLRVAHPVLNDLERLTMDVHGCVSLADPMGTIAVFRGEPSMVRWTERVFPTLGGCMSEDLVGTNSEGTAIEEGNPVQVWGGEHFNEALQDMYCTSVPIKDPLRRSIRGVLSLAFPERLSVELDSQSVLLIVQSAAAEITNALAARLAMHEQALLSEYLREVRKRGGEAVVAMNEHTTIASRGAMQLLEQSDYAVLAAYAREAERRGLSAEHEVTCGPGRVLQLQVRPVSAGDAAAGSIMRLRKSEPQPGRARPPDSGPPQDQFRGLVGESLAFRQAVAAASTAASRGMGAYIVGEPGTGKRLLSEALAHRLAEHTSTYYCGTISADDALDVERVAEELKAGHAIVFHQVEHLRDDPRDRLLDALSKVEQPRVVLTMRKLTDEMLPLISALRGMEIQLQPLRTRREDIPLLVNHFLSAVEPPRRATARLIEALTTAELPGNVLQLKEIIEAAALRANGSEVRLEDLTEPHRRALARSRLSRLQKAELQQIREALAEAGGNRLRAAAILRIGRSTLYRKIESYTSRGFDLELQS